MRGGKGKGCREGRGKGRTTGTRQLRDTYATATRLVRDRYETHSRLSRRLLGPKTIRAKKKTEVNFKCRGPVAFLRDSLAPGSRFLLGIQKMFTENIA